MESNSAERRLLKPNWSNAMIAASIALCFLGVFTSSQLMYHARVSVRLSTVFLWSMVGSLIFGFCSVWSFHEVAMLAYEFDLPVGVDPWLTILSALLAVSFTFAALAIDLLWDRYRNPQYRKRRRKRTNSKPLDTYNMPSGSSEPLLGASSDVEENNSSDILGSANDHMASRPASANGYIDQETATGSVEYFRDGHLIIQSTATAKKMSDDISLMSATVPREDSSDAQDRSSSDYSLSRNVSMSSGSFGIDLIARATLPSKACNPFISVATLIYAGCTWRNTLKGFLWSLAVTSMHYVGIFALRIPGGGFQLNPWLVLLSALCSWGTCFIGNILLNNLETQLIQQLLFSVIAASGISAMHFIGMAATTFWSTESPSDIRGYPPALANAVVGIAFATCIIANVLLAHSVTVSRNKLAEIIATRKELWKTITLKENAEAAARSRADFIASASHEIRTPLHHLQGYSDLLAQTELTEEGRSLLIAIQRATKTLSLITNNVLDWSKFEQNNEESYRPTALDIRSVAESVVVLLPNIDDDVNVQLYVVVSPNVPPTLFLDETWIHRILMNLLSNALKFTRTGYILLLIERRGGDLACVVQDTGCGLEPSFMPEMFKPFKQGEVRGSARGTGLGLSIIKQLLQRMNGAVDVESKYEQSEGIGSANSGTTFTVSLPISSNAAVSQEATTEEPKEKVAILLVETTRAARGMVECWQTAGYEPFIVQDAVELKLPEWKYIWTSLDFLRSFPSQFNFLLSSQDTLVLVPYDTHDSFEQLPGILTAPNFVLLQKPLIWHTFEKRIAAATSRSKTAGPSRALRFASQVEVIEGRVTIQHSQLAALKFHRGVLLVEDNMV
jgi:signal transduction histidine kinase